MGQHLEIEEGAEGNEELQAPVISKRGQDVDQGKARLSALIHRKAGRPA